MNRILYFIISCVIMVIIGTSKFENNSENINLKNKIFQKQDQRYKKKNHKYNKNNEKNQKQNKDNKFLNDFDKNNNNNIVNKTARKSNNHYHDKKTKVLNIQRTNHDLVFYDVEGPQEDDGAHPAKDIVSTINNTQEGETILMSAFSYTCQEIHQALIDALNRKVNVMVILDYHQAAQKYSLYHDKKNTTHNNDFKFGIRSLEKKYDNLKLYIHQKHGCAHKKMIIINDNIMFFGSYNFTYAAQKRNVEFLIKATVHNNESEYHESIQFYSERFFNTIINIEDEQNQLKEKLDNLFS